MGLLENERLGRRPQEEIMRTIHRDIVGAFIFSNDNKVLLGKTGVYAGKWVVPGGGLKKGETKLAGTIREVLEETGLDITDEYPVKLDIEQTGESEKVLRETGERVLVKMVFFDFVVRLKKSSDETPLQAGDDLVEIGWFSSSDIKDMNLAPPTLSILKELRFV